MEQYQSEQINELAAALSQFQGSVPTIEKNKKVKIRTKAGYVIEYDYADLADIMQKIRKPLSENGLAVSHSIQIQGQLRQLVTTLFHSSGQWIKSIIQLEQTGDEKTLGGKITYYRRYSLASLLGIVSDDDVDADLQGGMKSEEPVVSTKPEEPELSTEAKALQTEFKKDHQFMQFVQEMSSLSKKPGAVILHQAAMNRDNFLSAFETWKQKKEKAVS